MALADGVYERNEALTAIFRGRKMALTTRKGLF